MATSEATPKAIIVSTAEEACRESLRVEAKFGPMHSAHETYGVLCEELYEALMAMHANDDIQFRKELIQIAAVAIRGAATTL